MQDRVQLPRPLSGMRVIDMADGKAETAGRYFADLGADVIRVEPPEGASSRTAPPLVDGVSLSFAVHNTGKRGVVIDHTTPGGQSRLDQLLATADIWIETEAPRSLGLHGFGPEDVLNRHPQLVVLSVTDFGQTGPYRDWAATDWTHLAMGGVLSRSGVPGREPLMPPGDMAIEVTAMQAAWAALIAYWNRLVSGEGDHIDFSVFEATTQVIDPAMGTVGTAQAAGYAETRGRPAPGPYPIFRCRDGHVRLVVLAPRQWRAMRAWLGDPEDLLDPELDTIRGRALAAERLHAAYTELFRDKGKDELTAEGQARGVPIAPVLTPGDVLAAEHYRARGAIERREIAPGIEADVPTGFVEVGGARMSSSRRAPTLGEHDAEVFAQLPVRAAAETAVSAGGPRRPLEGLRVLDFGVIVLGAEVARLFADQGADVIKIESTTFPDGSRVSPVHFGIGHRGSRGLGLNLRSREGVEVLKRLVARSDVVLANFKPGTLDRLGLGYEVLREVNPGIVVVNSSAVGATGPWSTWMGYGPLVRCASGLTSRWRYPDDEDGFCDGTTIHPDHYAARVTAIAALSTLIARRSSGTGAVVFTSQAEAILMQTAASLAQESLRPGSVGVAGNSGHHAAPWGVYPCAGDDEWCAITVRDDDDWSRLRVALGDPAWAQDPELATAEGRIARRDDVDERVTAWTTQHAPREVTRLLQEAGVPAGFMHRADEYEDDPQLQARDFFRAFEQPGLDPVVIENAPFTSLRIPAPENTPAPAVGQHTREICVDLLGMDADDVEHLLAQGALEAPVEANPDAGEPVPAT